MNQVLGNQSLDLTPEKLKELYKVIPYKWRIQSCSKTSPNATCVAFIDARAVMDLLDEVVGQTNWQSEFYNVDGMMFCRIGIKVNGEWIWKSDTGSEGNIEKEKSHASDCLKRAAVSWGIGRFLYESPIQFIKTNAKKDDKDNKFPYPVDDYGNKIKNLTYFINDMNGVQHKENKPLTAQQNVLKKAEEKVNKLAGAEAKSKKIVDDTLVELGKITSLEDLKVFRNKNTLLENSNNAYKKALSKKWEDLSDKINPEIIEASYESKPEPQSDKITNIDKNKLLTDEIKIINKTKTLPNWLIKLFVLADTHEVLKEHKANSLKWAKENKKTFSDEELDLIFAENYDRIAKMPYSQVVK